MADEMVQVENEQYSGFMDELLGGMEDPTPEQIEILEQLVRNITGRKDNTAKGVIKNLLRRTGETDLFRAWDALEYLHSRKGERLPEGGRKIVATGDLYGRGLTRAHFLGIKGRSRAKAIPVGYTIYHQLTSYIGDYGKPSEQQQLSRPAQKRRRKRHEEKVIEIMRDPVSTLDQIVEAEGPSVWKVITGALGMAKDQVRKFAEYVGVVSKASPQVARMRDPTENLVALQRRRGIANWYQEEHDEGKLPEHIRQAHYVIEDNLHDATLLQLFLYDMHAAKNRFVSREAVLNGLDDDMKLLCPAAQRKKVLEQHGMARVAPVIENLVGKYGTADLSRVQHFLQQENITFFDAERIMDEKPDIADIRFEGNMAIEMMYGGDVDHIFRKIMPFYMTDKFVWHQELKSGRERFRDHVYSLYLNTADYRMMKDLLWDISQADGRLVRNFIQQKSMPEFYRLRRELHVLGARIKLAEYVARKHGVDIRHLGSVVPGKMEELKQAANLKANIRDKGGNLKLAPATEFRDHLKPYQRRTLDSMGEGITLDDMVNVINEASHGARRDYHFNKAYEAHFSRIRDLATVDIFHVDDVSRIYSMFAHAKSKVSILPGDKVRSLRERARAMLGDARVRISGFFPVISRFMSTRELEIAEGDLERYDRFRAGFAEPSEETQYDADREFLKPFEESFGDSVAKIYSGRIARGDIGRKASLGVHLLAMDVDYQRDSFWQNLMDAPYAGKAEIYPQDKVAAQVSELRTKHKTLAALLETDPEFSDKLKALEAAGRQGIGRQLDVSKDSFGNLQAIVREATQHTEESSEAYNQRIGNIYISNELVGALDNAYSLVQNPPPCTVVTGVLYTGMLGGRMFDSPRHYDQHKDDEGFRYNAAIPSGKRGQPNDTFKYQQVFKRLGMHFDRGNWGYLIKGIKREKLAEITEAVAELNKKPGVKFQVALVKLEER